MAPLYQVDFNIKSMMPVHDKPRLYGFLSALFRSTLCVRWNHNNVELYQCAKIYIPGRESNPGLPNSILSLDY